jgi:hypothetical protein
VVSSEALLEPVAESGSALAPVLFSEPVAEVELLELFEAESDGEEGSPFFGGVLGADFESESPVTDVTPLQSLARAAPLFILFVVKNISSKALKPVRKGRFGLELRLKLKNILRAPELHPFSLSQWNANYRYA